MSLVINVCLVNEIIIFLSVFPFTDIFLPIHASIHSFHIEELDLTPFYTQFLHFAGLTGELLRIVFCARVTDWLFDFRKLFGP